MARTMIDIDEDALAAAAKVLGTSTKKDTVNTALRETVTRLGRRAAFEELREMARNGDIDLDFLEDLHTSEKAAAAKAEQRTGVQQGESSRRAA